jgi:hypothetical protein
MPSLRVAAPTALACLALSVPAHAADPIMPLSQVKKGMQCTSLSVVQGTEISSFDAEVLDVVAGDAAQRQPLILVRVSGEAVEPTGIAEGFSGSPLICPDEDGVQRTAGAIAFASGDYGGKVALATPIESLLGLRADPPPGTRRNSRAARRARPLAAPLSVSGLSVPVGQVFRRAASRAGRRIQVAPAAPLTSSFPPQQLRPGASMAVGVASGDISAGAVGTVTYVDGERVWGFGHPFDAVGRRTLLLKDAYVYTVIGNPVGIGEAVSHKLAAPGHDLGTITADGPPGIAGRLGPLPPRVPVRVEARDADTGERHVIDAQVADETAAGQPAGGSGLSLVGPMAVSQAAFAVLGSSPSRLSGSMCARITVRESERPFRFCNTYVGAGGGPQDADEGALPGGALVADLGEALAEIDAFQLGEVHVTGVNVRLTLVRGLRQAYLLRARAPRVVRRGTRVRVRLTLQRVFGRRFTRTVRVRIPRGAPLGRRDLVLAGTPADASDEGAAVIDLADALDGEEPSDDGGPRSVGELGDRIRDLARYDGITAALARPGRDGGAEWRGYRDPSLRISGRERLSVFVAP